MPDRLKKIPYSTVTELLKHELPNHEGEDDGTAALFDSLRHVRKTKRMTRAEFLSICRWKSPRAVRHYSKNDEHTIQNAVQMALATRSERKRLNCLTRLKGVNIPMASAILTLTNPERYCVIDIRVWQLLYAMRSVCTKQSGTGFSFNDWYHYLKKLRYLAARFGVSVRTVELVLFRYHRKMQLGTLYGSQSGAPATNTYRHS
jgi:hypothetical protein